MKNEVFICFTKISDLDKRYVHDFFKYISKEKRDKLNLFKSDADYNRSLCAEIIVRQFFIESFSLNNAEIHMNYDKLGKPYIENFPNTHFSISHSGNYIIVAFSSELVGADIEIIKDFNYNKIANRYFENSEKNYVFGAKSIASLKRFYNIWTIKESYTKLQGVGLTKGFNYFSVEKSQHSTNEFNVYDKNLNKQYLAKSYELDDNYIFSICSENDFNICLKSLDSKIVQKQFRCCH
ncbi:MAG: 4'-phosphopantetheinyl transferase superfamily protein [Oscillospiraceae bacterium]|jgi:4'-phosphopantetheinyl transferase|nr:4'-phosphopantetheinyl transferase superfamily protein [Oscillospiraceae bacterium]